MKIIIGMALIASQASAGPIGDNNPDLMNKLNSRREAVAASQGIKLTPSPTLSSSPSGGLNNAGSFFKPTVLNNGSSPSTGTSGTSGSGTTACKTQADVAGDFDKMLANLMNGDDGCSGFLKEAAKSPLYMQSNTCTQVSGDTGGGGCQPHGMADQKLKVWRARIQLPARGTCTQITEQRLIGFCWSSGCGGAKGKFFSAPDSSDACALWKGAK